MDDSEFEVSSLHDEADESAPVTDTTPRAPWGSRGRLRRAGAVGAMLAVLLTGALIVGLTPGSRSVVVTLFTGTPTPTEAIPFGADILYFEHAVPWARTTPAIDGKPLEMDLRISSVTFLHVGRGRHTLTYTVAPFAPLRCVFTVPAAKTDTCPTGSLRDLGLPSTVRLARVIDLGGTPAKLPTDQLASLQADLDPLLTVAREPTTVQTGERYLTDDGVKVASQPLHATLIYQAAESDEEGCPIAGTCAGDCLTLCISAQEGSGGDWIAQAFFQSGWRYTSASGAAVGQLSTLFGTASPGLLSVLFTISWQGSWQITEPSLDFQVRTPNPTCSITSYAPEIIQSLATAEFVYYAYGATSAPNPADGCLFNVERGSIQTAGDTTNLLLLYRFGVLLTVDEQGASLLPNLPAADAYERTLAQQIVATQPQN